jgi:hypothetical protein
MAPDTGHVLIVTGAAGERDARDVVFSVLRDLVKQNPAVVHVLTASAEGHDGDLEVRGRAVGAQVVWGVTPPVLCELLARAVRNASWRRDLSGESTELILLLDRCVYARRLMADPSFSRVLSDGSLGIRLVMVTPRFRVGLSDDALPFFRTLVAVPPADDAERAALQRAASAIASAAMRDRLDRLWTSGVAVVSRGDGGKIARLEDQEDAPAEDGRRESWMPGFLQGLF